MSGVKTNSRLPGITVIFSIHFESLECDRLEGKLSLPAALFCSNVTDSTSCRLAAVSVGSYVPAVWPDPVDGSHRELSRRHLAVSKTALWDGRRSAAMIGYRERDDLAGFRGIMAVAGGAGSGGEAHQSADRRRTDEAPNDRATADRGEGGNAGVRGRSAQDRHRQTQGQATVMSRRRNTSLLHMLGLGNLS